MRRNTIQRDIVLDAVCTLKRHATADEVFEYLHVKHPSISRGTVYRNLNILCEDGGLKRVEVANGSDHFDHNLQEHYHVNCSQCGKIEDIDYEAIEDLTQHIKDAHGFKIIRCNVLLKGICQECLVAIE